MLKCFFPYFFCRRRDPSPVRERTSSERRLAAHQEDWNRLNERFDFTLIPETQTSSNSRVKVAPVPRMVLSPEDYEDDDDLVNNRIREMEVEMAQAHLGVRQHSGLSTATSNWSLVCRVLLPEDLSDNTTRTERTEEENRLDQLLQLKVKKQQ